MWQTLFNFIIILSFVYLAAATVYWLMLALAYFFVREPQKSERGQLNRFAILVPAHNEELLISRLCESLIQNEYPQELYEVFIVADNCNDNTVQIAESFKVNVLKRKNHSQKGKGYALKWGLKHIDLMKFDAVLIIDADCTTDSKILYFLNQYINSKHNVIQCYSTVKNRSESYFTQLLYISRTINNLLFHHSKYKVGLSSHLMGTGVCIKTSLLQKKGWTAFSIGEDWEYYAQLIDDHIKIAFAADAKVFHQESKSLEQATSQRLRWSKGRLFVARKFGVKLFLKGLRKADFFYLDASLPLVFPNYSLQINLTLLTLLLCLFTPTSETKILLIQGILGLISAQFLLFLMGIFLAGSIIQSFKAVLFAPVFLIWKMSIDFLSITGLYKGDKWVRTKRHIS